MNHICMMMYIKLMQAKQDFLEEERGAVDIVAIVVLIGIAVVLALVFRQKIVDLLDKLFAGIEGNALDATSKMG